MSIGQNPKAFTFSNPGKVGRQGARSHDVCPDKIVHVAIGIRKLINILFLAQREEATCTSRGSIA